MMGLASALAFPFSRYLLLAGAGIWEEVLENEMRFEALGK
jgi:hypothetical protein